MTGRAIKNLLRCVNVLAVMSSETVKASLGTPCRRIESIGEIVPVAEMPVVAALDLFVYRHCKKTSTVEHHDDLWCSNYGSFATPPDPKLLPSIQPGFVEAVWD
jgi:hypothetical protein